MSVYRGLSVVLTSIVLAARALAETVDLGAVRAAVEKYKDVKVALATATSRTRAAIA